MKTKFRFLLLSLPVSLLLNAPLLASEFRLPLPKAPQGRFGFARYTLRDSDVRQGTLKPGAQLFNTHNGAMEFLTPIDDMKQLDELGALSHDATGFCGSMDYYPKGFSLADTMSHVAPYFPPRAHFSDLETILSDVQLAKMNTTIDTLGTYVTRFHRNELGQNAGTTVLQLWQNQLQSPADWTIDPYTHINTPQKSVIARLPGASADTVVLGAHLDSIASRTNYDAIAPGADDDASGIAILTEILRIIETRHLRFHRSIELHGYAAEEVGLVGSREIATKYKSEARPIDAMLQFDMAYYSKNADNGLLFFLEDFTALDLTRSGIQWVKSYMGDVYKRGAMPRGAASDHKSWWEQGYPTLFPFENAEADNPYIHTANDTKDKFDDGTRMQRMVKFGLIFLAYEAGLESLDSPNAAEQNRLMQETIAKDLALALTGTADHYTFAVSAPETTQYLEFCPMDSETDFRCSAERQRLTASELKKGRRIFYSTSDQVFKADDKWRIEAYDGSDTLLARRQIQWQK
ncbi:MAG: M20/M25/M40 family metallo-hydrolase [Chitinophagaceae bacterium]|nr:M20/M25/M40 family metallo-hydrolase [Oligoflexus sp.]